MHARVRVRRQGIGCRIARLGLVWGMWLAAGVWTPAIGENLPVEGTLSFPPDLIEPFDLSGIAIAGEGERIFLVSDEGDQLQAIERVPGGRYRPDGALHLLEEEDEADLEGLAIADGWLYVIGSHSAKREKVAPDKKRAKNRERLYDTDAEESRRLLARVPVDADLDGDPEIERADLWPRIEGDALLEPFTVIPGKENGMDIEGIAVQGERVLIGLRSPVLREGHAIVIDTRFRSTKAELLFLDLQGLGIRDMAFVGPDEVLLLCGPAADVEGEIRLKLWNGKDMTPGSEGPPPGKVRDLGVVPASPGEKPEGIAVLKLEGNVLQAVVVSDGGNRGAPRVIRVDLAGGQ